MKDRMILRKQPNKWTCGVTSLAMVLNVDTRDILSQMSHDGSMILFPNLKEPKNRRGFAIQELLDVARISFGVGFVPYEADPLVENVHVYNPDHAEKRMMQYMKRNIGLIEGAYGLDSPHMCAWDGSLVYDPSGRTYSMTDPESINILCFWQKVDL